MVYLHGVIDNNKRLADLIDVLGSSKWVAIDTEADSLHAYPEKLCLIQLSCERADALIDPLAAIDLKTGFIPLIARKPLIFHGADYDLRMLYRTCEFVPEQLFDTMIAARLLGYEQFGLIHLVERHLTVKLEKGPQKMNWARRPLTPRMEAYAQNDTRYLKPLADILTELLAAKGRLSWSVETCQKLIVECSKVEPADPESIWRLKGSDRLNSTALAILRELWTWREKEAREANKPPFFIVSHDVLLDWSVALAGSVPPQALLPSRIGGEKRNRLLDAVERGLAVPRDEQPQRRRTAPVYPTVAEQKRFAEIKARRDAMAQDLNIDPTLIASKNILLLLAQNWEKSFPRLMEWQKNLLSH